MANLVVPATALGNVMPVPKGEWIQGVTYKPLNIVTHNNNAYIALQENAVEPPEDGDANWMLIVKGVTKADVNKLGIVKPDGTTITISKDGTITGAKQVPDNVLVAVEIGEDDPDLPSLPALGIDADRLGGELPEYFASAQSVTDVIDKIGNLDNLSTDDKTTIISAMNEIFGNLSELQINKNLGDNYVMNSNDFDKVGFYLISSLSDVETDEGFKNAPDGNSGDYKVLALNGSDSNYQVVLMTSPRDFAPLYIGFFWNQKWKGWTRIANIKNLCNPDILINSNFKNSINQRGQTEYTVRNGYTIDRWKFNDGWNNKLVIKSGYITFSSVNEDLYKSLYQLIENYSDYAGKTVTFSAKVKTLCSYAGIEIEDSDSKEIKIITPSSDWQIVSVTKQIVSNTTKLQAGFFINPHGTEPETETMDIEWAKLEVGSIATMYVPPNLAEELLKCQRYYYRINRGTYDSLIYLGIAISTANRRFFHLTLTLPVEMRVDPTFDFGDGLECKLPNNSQTYTTNVSIQRSAAGPSTVIDKRLITLELAFDREINDYLMAVCLEQYNIDATHIAFDAELY